MRQFRLYYKRGPNGAFSPLEPNVHAGLYQRPEIEAALDHIQANPVVEGMALRMGDEMFNVFAFEQEAHGPMAFLFDDRRPTAAKTAPGTLA